MFKQSLYLSSLYTFLSPCFTAFYSKLFAADNLIFGRTQNGGQTLHRQQTKCIWKDVLVCTSGVCLHYSRKIFRNIVFEQCSLSLVCLLSSPWSIPTVRKHEALRPPSQYALVAWWSSMQTTSIHIYLHTHLHIHLHKYRLTRAVQIWSSKYVLCLDCLWTRPETFMMQRWEGACRYMEKTANYGTGRTVSLHCVIKIQDQIWTTVVHTGERIRTDLGLHACLNIFAHMNTYKI
jgi:hypothetical protein